jgi:2-(1,2-epoxy-1,2-dihydrophenyl)acetyl-CoA isomerase
MYREAVDAIERANGSDDDGAIVVTHEGPVFCSGVDFKAPPEPPDPATGRRPNVAMLSMAQDVSWLHLLARSKPSVAAVRGAAIGLGVTQILPMDIRVGGAASTYAFPFLSLSLMPELGCTALLPRLVGYGRAVDICLTSAKLAAGEAERIGLISRVVPDGEVVEAAVALAEKVAAVPPLQLGLTRKLLRDNAGEHDPNVFLQRETDAFITMFKAARAAAREE